MPVASGCAAAVAGALQALCAGAHPTPPVLTPSMEPAMHIPDPLAFETNGQPHLYASSSTLPGPFRAAGVTFPLYEIPLTVDMAHGKIGFDLGAYLGGGTLTVDQPYLDLAPPAGVSPGDRPLKLTINAPGSGVSLQLTQDLSPGFPTFGGAWLLGPQGEDSGSSEVGRMSYLAWGGWNAPTGTAGVRTSAAFLAGFETPLGGIPFTGTFTYGRGTLLHNVRGEEAVPTGSGYQGYDLYGDATFSVDFASGKIAGSFRNMQARNADTNVVVGPWNDVSVSAVLTANTFSGITIAGASPGNIASMPTGARGEFKGLFYGPNAEQLGAVWTLASGQVGAVGAVGATH